MRVPSEPDSRFFRKSPLSHILNCPDIFELAVFVTGALSDQVQVLDREVDHLQPIFVIEIADAASCLFDHVTQQKSIFRMYSGGDQLESYRRARFKAEGAIELLGPCDFSCRHAP